MTASSALEIGAIAANRGRYAAFPMAETPLREVPLSCVAYFSMEFMLSEASPIYSGGLGNVAGDQLKDASWGRHGLIQSDF